MHHPFDIDDVVDVAGVTGEVKSMNLVSTTITTFDNKIMVVPNNSIWGNIITNITGSEHRRIDFVFGIGYDDDVEKAKALMKEAGCNAMSIGIFSWVSLEPDDGVYTFDWLDAIMDMLHANGMFAVLATPSAAQPAWMPSHIALRLTLRPTSIRKVPVSLPKACGW